MQTSAVPCLEGKKAENLRLSGDEMADIPLCFDVFYNSGKMMEKPLRAQAGGPYNRSHQPRKEGRLMTEGGRLVLIIFVTAAAATDLRDGRIYNFLILPTWAAGLWLVLIRGGENLPEMLESIFLTLVFLYPFWRIEGLGAGDIKMFLALIPLMGSPWYLFSFVLSFVVGGAVAVVLIMREPDLTRTVHLAVPIGISVLFSLLLEQAGVRIPQILTAGVAGLY